MTDSLAEERLDELDALALAATPGPWVHDSDYVWCGNVDSAFEGTSVADSTPRDTPFIAALDPDTVRALIAMARRAQEAEAERDEANRWRDVFDKVGAYGALKAELSAYRQRMATQLQKAAKRVRAAEARAEAAEAERDEAVHHAEIALGRATAANEKLGQMRAMSNHAPTEVR